MKFTKEEINKNIIYSLIRETDKGNLDVIDHLYADGYREYTVNSSKSDLHTPSQIKTVLQHFRDAFPDTIHTIEDLVSENDKVAARISFKGTFLNPLWGHEPTGKLIEATSIVIYRIKNGKIVEKWGGISASDLLGIKLTIELA